ncbi:MAG TPA: sugar phosphate isomerase/epimerase family protein [Opitutaceae bacterium]|nr:sugar phosphate isomerase/epimerase family protein [Opitutaceae bacterium]
MQLGLCTTPDVVATLPSLPFEFIEAHVWQFFIPEQPDAAFAPRAAAAKACPLPTPAANSLFPPDLKVTGPSVDVARMTRFAETAFSRAASIGLTTIVFGSAGARMVPEGWSMTRGFEQYVEALKLLAPVAQKYGIMLVVEALNRGECNLVNTIDEGAEAVKRCNHPNVRLLVDIFHMLRNGESPDGISRHAALVTHSHVAEDKDRAEPGKYNDDFRPYLKALRAATLCQRLTIECVWSTGDLRQGYVGALQALRRQLADAGY